MAIGILFSRSLHALRGWGASLTARDYALSQIWKVVCPWGNRLGIQRSTRRHGMEPPSRSHKGL